MISETRSPLQCELLIAIKLALYEKCFSYFDRKIGNGTFPDLGRFRRRITVEVKPICERGVPEGCVYNGSAAATEFFFLLAMIVPATGIFVSVCASVLCASLVATAASAVYVGR